MKLKYIKKEDNTNGIKGYKVFQSDWTCRPEHQTKQYQCPGIFLEKGELQLCQNGMHFCQTAVDCFNYYNFDPKLHIAEVIAWGNVATQGDKSCTDELEIVRELSWEEVLSIVNFGHDNTGKRNTGCNNTGDCNTGHYNCGIYNSGNHNSGSNNTGSYNSGHQNTGNNNAGNWNSGTGNDGDCNTGFNNLGNFNSGQFNTGNYNTGLGNSGNSNTGDWNVSSCNAGCFNTTEETICLFNKPSDWTQQDWLRSKARHLLCHMLQKKLSEFKNVSNDKNDSTFEQDWWDDLSENNKDEILSLPNFDSKIFLECTGIDVTK